MSALVTQILLSCLPSLPTPSLDYPILNPTYSFSQELLLKCVPPPPIPPRHPGLGFLFRGFLQTLQSLHLLSATTRVNKRASSVCTAKVFVLWCLRLPPPPLPLLKVEVHERMMPLNEQNGREKDADQMLKKRDETDGSRASRGRTGWRERGGEGRCVSG